MKRSLIDRVVWGAAVLNTAGLIAVMLYLLSTQFLFYFLVTGVLLYLHVQLLRAYERNTGPRIRLPHPVAQRVWEISWRAAVLLLLPVSGLVVLSAMAIGA